MSQEFIPKYTPEYFDDCLNKVNKLDKLTEPYEKMRSELQAIYVIIEAYRCCGDEIDFMPEIIEKIDKLWDIVCDAQNEIERKKDPWLSELMNE